MNKYKEKYEQIYKDLYSGYEKCCRVIDSCANNIVIGDRAGNLRVYIKAGIDNIEERKEAAIEYCENWLGIMHNRIDINRYDSFFERLKMKLTGEINLFVPAAQQLVAMSNKFRDDFGEESTKFDIAPRKHIGF